MATTPTAHTSTSAPTTQRDGDMHPRPLLAGRPPPVALPPAAQAVRQQRTAPSAATSPHPSPAHA
ncbi:hypothetical protein DXG01_012314 [Tephrocybe rancida]|nr:hypothetical protein DXG01_012314 [Tephrocybe rancida]